MKMKKQCAPNPLAIYIYEMSLRALETHLKSLNALLSDSSPSIFQFVVKSSLNKVLSSCTYKTCYFLFISLGKFFCKNYIDLA